MPFPASLTPSSTFPIRIFGAGRLGHALAHALAPHPTTLHKTRPLEYPEKPDESAIWILTISDDAIPLLAQSLAQSLASSPHPPQPLIVLHTSGRCSLDALQIFAKQGASIGTLHPLLSLATPSKEARPPVKEAAPPAKEHPFRGCFFGIEGDPLALQAAQEIAASLDASTFSLAGMNRALYHAAAVTASNYLVALASQAALLLQAAGFQGDPLPPLLPLMQASLHHLNRCGLPHALTGPLARGDLQTLHAHLHALQQLDAANPPQHIESADASAPSSLLPDASTPAAEAPNLSHTAFYKTLALVTLPIAHALQESQGKFSPAMPAIKQLLR